MDICMQPLFLRIIYYIKLFLNILRFVVPIALIIKCGMDLYKSLLDTNEKNGVKNLKNRIIAGVVVFLIPTLINLLMNLIEYVNGINSYNGISECWEFADLDYIEQLEKEISEEELKAYLNERERLLEKSAQLKLALKKLVESNKAKDQVGEHANNNNTITCGSGSNYNQGLYNYVRAAGYKTREGVVAAALYLSSHIDVHIPYFWSGGHFHNYNGYHDSGENFMGVSDKWGCSVKMAFGGTESQKNGVAYPFGMDCSGFITWAIYNGGYYTGDKNQQLIISTSALSSSIGGVNVTNSTLENSKGKVKPGDILYKKGHVGLVVKVEDNQLIVAEERGYKYGLVITEIKYSSTRFSHAIFMDNFYKNYKKNNTLWEGFK